jgi:tRNA 5-methylaminomethyl-2-thiouridine biosynthesis bifunctional protein
MNWVWNEEEGSLFSSEFQDIYYSRSGGLKETQLVFFEPNRIPYVFQSSSNSKSGIHLGELGFGTGLNFFASVDTWNQTSNRKNHLHYTAFENTLLPLELILKIFKYHFPNHDIPLGFETFWKHIVLGCNRYSNLENNYTLDLWFGDAGVSLPEIDGKIDVWFWDGFSPDKNPGIWNDQIFKEVGRLSQAGTTGSTYTSSRTVKDLLDQNGFKWERIEQKGSKRHTLQAVYQPENIFTDSYQKSYKPWCRLKPRYLDPSVPIAVIGSGIAGSSIAHSLTQRGFKVEIFEKESSIGSGASGNPSAVVIPHLSKSPIPYSRFSLQAYLYAIRLYTDRGLWIQKPHYHYYSDKERSRYESLAKVYSLNHNLYQLETINGKPVAIFPEGGAVNPISILRKFTKDTLIHFNSNLRKFSKNGNIWEIHYEENSMSKTSNYSAVIWADGKDARISSTGRFYNTVRGQIEYIQSGVIDSISGSVYACPGEEGGGVLGATFDEFHLEPLYRANEREDLMNSWNQNFPEHPIQMKSDPPGRVSYRSQTKDRIPIIGVTIDQIPEIYKKFYSSFNKTLYPILNNEGMFQLRGLGSRGFTHAPLLAEELVSQILGETSVMTWAEKDSFSEMRFHLRELRDSKTTEG